jgi:hypothetical protein
MDLLEVPAPIAFVDRSSQEEKRDSGSQAFRSFLTAAMDDKYDGDHYMLENAPPQSEDFVRLYPSLRERVWSNVVLFRNMQRFKLR